MVHSANTLDSLAAPVSQSSFDFSEIKKFFVTCWNLPNKPGLTLGLITGLLLAIPVYSVAAETKDGKTGDSLFGLYAENKQQGIPNYVTADLPMMGYALLRSRQIEELEKTQIFPAFRELTSGLAERLQEFIDSEKATDAIVANLDYMQLLLVLQGDQSIEMSPKVAAEYALVTSGQSIELSPMWGREIDYTQFQARGRYSQTEELANKFRAMRYAGSALFAVVPSAATAVSESESHLQSAQADNLIRLIDQHADLSQSMKTLDSALEWQFGAARDLDVDDWLQVSLSSNHADIDTLRPALLEYARQNDRQPHVFDLIVEPAKLSTEHSIPDVLTGWRLLPSRDAAQSAVSQALVFSETGVYEGPKQNKPFGYDVINGSAVKAYPEANELLSLLRCDLATKQLKASHSMEFEGYSQASIKAKAHLLAATGAEAAQLDILSVGAQTLPQLRPDTSLGSMLAFNTWSLAQNILYAKQSYTVVSKGISLIDDREGADLEPATELYFALAQAARAQLKHTDNPAWGVYAQHLETLQGISFRRSRGVLPNSQEQRFLNNLDSALLMDSSIIDKPMVADVHTSPATATVVYNATGLVETVKKGSARGAHLSFLEFKRPANERLTVESWRAELAQTEG